MLGLSWQLAERDVRRMLRCGNKRVLTISLVMAVCIALFGSFIQVRSISVKVLLVFCSLLSVFLAFYVLVFTRVIPKLNGGAEERLRRGYKKMEEIGDKILRR